MNLLKGLRKKYEPLNLIEINKENLLNNYDFFCGLDQKVWPVLKANAYGHGIKQVTQC